MVRCSQKAASSSKHTGPPLSNVDRYCPLHTHRQSPCLLLPHDLPPVTLACARAGSKRSALIWRFMHGMCSGFAAPYDVRSKALAQRGTRATPTNPRPTNPVLTQPPAMYSIRASLQHVGPTHDNRDQQPPPCAHPPSNPCLPASTDSTHVARERNAKRRVERS